MPAEIITANRLTDGRVIFLAAAEDWTTEVAEALILAGEGERDAAMKIAERAVAKPEVVAPYAIEVDVVDGKPSPVRLRERIRAEGPTVRYGA